MTNALTPVDAANMALAQAETTDDFVAVRTAATAAKAWVKARGMGIDEENKATTVILRAERGAGLELIRMAESGERATQASARTSWFQKDGDQVGEQDLIQLEDLGVTKQQASDWQRAARIPEDEFESMLALAIESGTRLAKVNFYRPEPKVKEANALPTKEDGGFLLLREGVYQLLGWKVDGEGTGHPTKNGLLMLPLDELQKVGVLLQHMIAAFNEVRAQR